MAVVGIRMPFSGRNRRRVRQAFHEGVDSVFRHHLSEERNEGRDTCRLWQQLSPATRSRLK